MEFHSENGLRALDLGRRTKNGVVLERLVGAVGDGGGGDGAGGHVVAVDLDAVDVGNDTVLVQEVHLVRRHVGQSGEGPAEVLRSRDGGCGRAERDGRPRGVGEAEDRPVAGNGAGNHLPLGILLDGVVERERVGFLRAGDHHDFEDDVAVGASHLEPGSGGPGIAVGVLQKQRVLVVGGDSETDFGLAQLVVDECGAGCEESGSRVHLVRLLTRVVGSTLLGELGVHLAGGAGVITHSQ